MNEYLKDVHHAEYKCSREGQYAKHYTCNPCTLQCDVCKRAVLLPGYLFHRRECAKALVKELPERMNGATELPDVTAEKKEREQQKKWAATMKERHDAKMKKRRPTEEEAVGLMDAGLALQALGDYEGAHAMLTKALHIRRMLVSDVGQNHTQHAKEGKEGRAQSAERRQAQQGGSQKQTQGKRERKAGSGEGGGEDTAGAVMMSASVVESLAAIAANLRAKAVGKGAKGDAGDADAKAASLYEGLAEQASAVLHGEPAPGPGYPEVEASSVVPLPVESKGPQDVARMKQHDEEDWGESSQRQRSGAAMHTEGGEDEDEDEDEDDDDPLNSLSFEQLDKYEKQRQKKTHLHRNALKALEEKARLLAGNTVSGKRWHGGKEGEQQIANRTTKRLLRQWRKKQEAEEAAAEAVMMGIELVEESEESEEEDEAVVEEEEQVTAAKALRRREANRNKLERGKWVNPRMAIAERSHYSRSAVGMGATGGLETVQELERAVEMEYEQHGSSLPQPRGEEQPQILLGSRGGGGKEVLGPHGAPWQVSSSSSSRDTGGYFQKEMTKQGTEKPNPRQFAFRTTVYRPKEGGE
jgi:hypothetical protein